MCSATTKLRKTLLKSEEFKSERANQSTFKFRAGKMSIIGLADSLSLIKEDYRGKVQKLWKEFVEKNGDEFDEKPPTEEQFLSYF